MSQVFTDRQKMEALLTAILTLRQEDGKDSVPMQLADAHNDACVILNVVLSEPPKPKSRRPSLVP